MAIIEGTGIKAPSKESAAKATAFLSNFQKKADEKFIKTYERKQEGGIKNSDFETDRYNKLKQKYGDQFSSDASDEVNKPSFFSMTKDTKVASTDLSGLVGDDKASSTFGTSFTDQASANLADASVYKTKEDGIYRPSDNIYDSLKGIKFPSIDKDKPTTFTDSSGDVYTKKPYTETTPGMKFYGGTGAELIRKKDDDPKFSQPYSEASNKEAFMKERNAYLKDTGEYSGMISFEKKKPIRGFGDALGAALGLNDRGYPTKTDRFIESSANQDYKEFRKEMRDKVFSESPYGKDVEKKYYYKDFQQPGVYRSEKEVQSYIKDRGAALTGMPSNFPGGVSGIGKKTDDFSKDPRYQSTAGTFAKETKEPSTLQKVGNFLGNITNQVLGMQSAEASQIGGPLPNTGQSITTGDTTPKQTVASLPSDYKQTEAREFAKAAAFQQAKKNPNVTVGVDSKGQPVAKAVQKGRGESKGDNTAQGNQARVQQNAKARAQAAAFNRRMSGKSISQVKAANRQSMKDSAAERQKAFKKTGKSTVGARRAAAKKRVQAAAKKRHAAFKKRRAESKARKAARNAARKKQKTRRSRRSRSR